MDCATESPGVVLRFISRVVAMVHPSFRPRANLARSAINKKERGEGRKGPAPQTHFPTSAASSFNTPDSCPHSFS